MAIIRYPVPQPTYPVWRDFDAVSNRLSRFLDVAPSMRGGDGPWSPAVSIVETKEELILTAELSGLAEDDIRLEIENDVLTISGEKTEESAEDDVERRYHVWERRYGSFRRSFKLARSVDGAEANATFDEGVLTVRLPKAAEAQGRTIEISKN